MKNGYFRTRIQFKIIYAFIVLSRLFPDCQLEILVINVIKARKIPLDINLRRLYTTEKIFYTHCWKYMRQRK